MSDLQSPLRVLMQKELTRKQFLGIVGLAVVSVVGLGHILKLMTGKSIETHQALQTGDGSTAYGGHRG